VSMSEKILENVSKYVRGSHGLFENVDYVFNEDQLEGND
jgi:hypothetical protein